MSDTTCEKKFLKNNRLMPNPDNLLSKVLPLTLCTEVIWMHKTTMNICMHVEYSIWTETTDMR